MNKASISVLFLSAFAASGCIVPREAAFPQAPDLAAGTVQPPASVSASTAPAGGLDEDAVAALAVQNAPALKAARARAGVAKAQLFEAGLLPNPQLSVDLGRSSNYTGYSVGVSGDVRAFFLRGAARSTAQAASDETRLEILWQEWQTAEKARELFIQSRADDALEKILGEARDLLLAQYQLDLAAFQKDPSALEKVSADLSVLSDAEGDLRNARLDADRTRHELNLLLGLAPEAKPALAGEPSEIDLSSKDYHAALDSLPEHRFDLLALRAGYNSSEQSLRLAALERFPPLHVSLQKGRSAEEGVDTVGFGVELGLPFFDGGRGRVAVERATRDGLRQAYQARLDEAASQADEVRQAVLLMGGQLRELDSRIADMSGTADTAEQRFRDGVLGADVYVSLKKSLLADREESVRLKAALAKARAALNALLGLPLNKREMPVRAMPASVHSAASVPLIGR